MPLPSLFLADILGVFVLQNLVYRFRSFVLRRRCAIVPQSYFHYQNCVQISFRYCFKISILRTSVTLLSHSFAYTLFMCNVRKKGGKVRLSLGKYPKILGFVPCEYVTHTKNIWYNKTVFLIGSVNANSALSRVNALPRQPLTIPIKTRRWNNPYRFRSSRFLSKDTITKT